MFYALIIAYLYLVLPITGLIMVKVIWEKDRILREKAYLSKLITLTSRLARQKRRK